MKKGKVKLVGAGPGDKDLITVKGLRAIQKADVILYDALVNKELLKEAPEDVELIYVGKRAGFHSSTQDEINLLLLQSALQYQNVVRLKGGDPFIFGRGHEEIEYLNSFGVETEIVPGLSSCTSLPHSQQVPLTRRGISESFWVMTGTTSYGKLSEDIRHGIRSTATLVILMGIKKITQIARILEEEGKSDMPVMIIQNGSLKNEKVVITKGSKMELDARSNGIGTPGILVIGEVVSLHPDYIMEKYAKSWINHQQ